MNDKMWKPQDVIVACVAVSFGWFLILMFAIAVQAHIFSSEMVKHHSGYFNPVNGDTFIYRDCGPLTLTMP